MQQDVALAERDLEFVGEIQKHLAARLCATVLEVTEVTRRDVGRERKVELAASAAFAPLVQ
jgi:hypothetical protein